MSELLSSVPGMELGLAAVYPCGQLPSFLQLIGHVFIPSLVLNSFLSLVVMLTPS